MKFAKWRWDTGNLANITESEYRACEIAWDAATEIANAKGRATEMRRYYAVIATNVIWCAVAISVVLT